MDSGVEVYREKVMPPDNGDGRSDEHPHGHAFAPTLEHDDQGRHHQHRAESVGEHAFGARPGVEGWMASEASRSASNAAYLPARCARVERSHLQEITGSFSTCFSKGARGLKRPRIPPAILTKPKCSSAGHQMAVQPLAEARGSRPIVKARSRVRRREKPHDWQGSLSNPRNRYRTDRMSNDAAGHRRFAAPSRLGCDPARAVRDELSRGDGAGPVVRAGTPVLSIEGPIDSSTRSAWQVAISAPHIS